MKWGTIQSTTLGGASGKILRDGCKYPFDNVPFSSGQGSYGMRVPVGYMRGKDRQVPIALTKSNGKSWVGKAVPVVSIPGWYDSGCNNYHNFWNDVDTALSLSTSPILIGGVGVDYGEFRNARIDNGIIYGTYIGYNEYYDPYNWKVFSCPIAADQTPTFSSEICLFESYSDNIVVSGDYLYLFLEGKVYKVKCSDLSEVWHTEDTGEDYLYFLITTDYVYAFKYREYGTPPVVTMAGYLSCIKISQEDGSIVETIEHEWPTDEMGPSDVDISRCYARILEPIAYVDGNDRYFFGNFYSWYNKNFKTACCDLDSGEVVWKYGETSQNPDPITTDYAYEWAPSGVFFANANSRTSYEFINADPDKIVLAYEHDTQEQIGQNIWGYNQAYLDALDAYSGPEMGQGGWHLNEMYWDEACLNEIQRMTDWYEDSDPGNNYGVAGPAAVNTDFEQGLVTINPKTGVEIDKVPLDITINETTLPYDFYTAAPSNTASSANRGTGSSGPTTVDFTEEELGIPSSSTHKVLKKTIMFVWWDVVAGEGGPYLRCMWQEGSSVTQFNGSMSTWKVYCYVWFTAVPYETVNVTNKAYIGGWPLAKWYQMIVVDNYIVGFNSNVSPTKLVCHSLETGNHLWDFDLSASYDPYSCNLLVHKDKLYAVTIDISSSSFLILEINPSDGSLIRSKPCYEGSIMTEGNGKLVTGKYNNIGEAWYYQFYYNG